MKKNKIALILTSFALVFSALSFGYLRQNSVASTSEAASHPDNYSNYIYNGTYYSSINPSLTDGMEGTLRDALTTLIHPTSVPSYSGGGEGHLAEVLQSADEDPNNSSNMIYLYTRDSVTKNAASSWNREHVWPQSLSNSCWGQGRAGSDLLHIRPTYNTTNSTRSNDKYGNVTNGTTRIYNNIVYGYSSTTDTVFMPLDSVKGDVARICMYVWTAYHDEYGSKLPSLTNVFESFDTLMSWHTSDRPDVMEGNRNNYAENTSMQKNRNPFVDHPEYAWKIFGSQCSTSVLNAAKAAYPDGEAVGITSISRTSANLLVDETTTVNATSSDSSNITWSTSNDSVATISSTSTSSGTNITITAVGEGTAIITAQCTISGTNYSATCTINVTSSGGGGGGDTPTGDSFTITPSDLANGSYPTTPTSYTAASGLTFTAYNCANFSSKLQFKKNGGYLYNNSSLNLGSLTLADASGSLIVYAGTAKNPSTTTISGNNGVYDLSGYNYFKIINSSSNVASCTSVTVTLAASEKTLSSITVATAPSKTTYTAGEFFNPTGLVITRNYSDSTSDTYTYANHESEFSFTPSTSTALTTSNTSVSISYGGKSTSQAITVNPTPVVLSSISVSGMSQSYSYGDTFSFDGTCTAQYSDSSSKTVTPTSVSSPNMNSVGQQTITVTYTEGNVTKTASYTITVSDVLSSISVSGQTSSYYVGDTFSFDGTCTAQYVSGASKVVNPTSVSSPNMSSAGNKTVTVSYTEGGVNKSTSYSISVVNPTLLSISVSEQKTEYYVGDSFVKPAVTATYDNGNVDVSDQATFTGYDLSSKGNQTVIVSFGGKTTSYGITVSEKPAVSGYVKVKSSADITDGDYLIVYETGNFAFNSGLSPLDVTSNTIPVTIDNEVIESNATTDAAKFTIDASNGSIKLQSGNYYIGVDSYSNGLKTFTSPVSHSLSIDSDGNAVIVVATSGGDMTLRYNNNSGQTRFRYYKNASQQAIQLYKLNSGSTPTKALSSISLSGTYPTSFYEGGSFSTAGMVVTAYYDDESSANVTSLATFSGYDMSTTGQQTVTVSFTQGGVTKTAEYTITVNEVTPPTPVGDYSLTAGSPYINGIGYYMYFTSTYTTPSVDYFFTGAMDGHYGGTVTKDDLGDAAEVYFEASGNGQNIYFFDGTTPKYLGIVQSGSYYNFTISDSAPTTKWIYKTTKAYSCLTFDVGGVPYTFGTYSNKKTFGTVNLNAYPNSYLVQFMTYAGEGSKSLPSLLNTYITCDSTGAAAPNFSNYSWNQFANVVSNFIEYDKTQFKNAKANPSGTAMEQFVARYDYIVAKYGYTNFLDRNVSSISGRVNYNDISNGENSSLIIIIAIASFTLLATTLLVIKKKKR